MTNKIKIRASGEAPLNDRQVLNVNWFYSETPWLIRERKQATNKKAGKKFHGKKTQEQLKGLSHLG
jgi:hypothetical protein